MKQIISTGKRLALLAVVIAGVLLTAAYILAACPAQGAPPLPRRWRRPAPACANVLSPCPPWAG